MNNTTPLTLPFSDINARDLGLVGGKGANLGEMTNAGFPVPPAFVSQPQPSKNLSPPIPKRTPYTPNSTASPPMTSKASVKLAKKSVKPCSKYPSPTKSLMPFTKFGKKPMRRLPTPSAPAQPLKTCPMHLSQVSRILISTLSAKIHY